MKRRLVSDTRPWYREPWPWLLMVGPLVVIVAGIITTYLAIVSNDGLVEDDYYKQGLTVNRRTERDQKAIELDVRVDFVLAPDGKAIRALLRFNEGSRLPEALFMSVSHPTRAGFDQKVILQREGGRVFAGALLPVSEGRWHVSLEDDQREWRVVGEWIAGKDSSLRWTAAASLPGGRK